MSKKILVIEDETETRNIFLRCLAFESFDAMGAQDGTTGISMATQHRPDLVVCDIMMPDIDGYEVLTALRSQPITRTIPFIFLTAKVTMAELRKGMGLGADDYLTKPCTVEQFLEAIAARLTRQEALKRDYAQAAQLHAAQRQDSQPAAPQVLSIFPDCPKLAAVFEFIEAHYQQPIHLSDVAQAAGYSPAYLTNLSQSYTGRTIKSWIIERRMFQARQLLKETAQSIHKIAEMSGYSDAGYFTRQFRQLHGITPKKWRGESGRSVNNINYQASIIKTGNNGNKTEPSMKESY
ncbi:MAG: response regulator [Cyanobacteria bacterium P01_D01_bin.105]